MGLASVFELVAATVEEVIKHFIRDLSAIYRSAKSLLAHSKSHIVGLQDSKENQAVPESSPPRDTPVTCKSVLWHKHIYMQGFKQRRDQNKMPIRGVIQF